MNSLRIIFAGTPEFSVPSLQALLDSSHHVVAVYTQPDRPSGRGLRINYSPVKALALKYNLSIEQPATLKNEVSQKILANYRADVMIVIAYGLLLPEIILNTPKFGCINVHASLLPRWRGAAPIQRSILAGDTETGVTIMQMDKGLDTGAMLLKEKITIKPSDTSKILHDQLSLLGANALLKTLALLQPNKLQPEQQTEILATYAHKLTKEEALINWQLSADQITRAIHGYNPWPVAYTHLKQQTIRIWLANKIISSHQFKPGEILKIDAQGIQVACGQDILNINLLQFPGGKVISANDVLNAKMLKIGDILI